MHGARRQLVDRAVAAFAEWARLLESSSPSFPFADLSLTRTQIEALYVIAHSPQPATPSLVAGSVGVTAGAATQFLASMIGAGLVTQREDPGDRRRHLLELTPTCQDAIAQFEAAVLAGLEPHFGLLDDHELAILVALLERTRGPA